MLPLNPSPPLITRLPLLSPPHLPSSPCAQVFKVKDSEAGSSFSHVVDAILDKTGMKGTGRWTIQEAAERSIAAPTMAAALDARYLSGGWHEAAATFGRWLHLNRVLSFASSPRLS